MEIEELELLYSETEVVCFMGGCLTSSVFLNRTFLLSRLTHVLKGRKYVRILSQSGTVINIKTSPAVIPINFSIIVQFMQT